MRKAGKQAFQMESRREIIKRIAAIFLVFVLLAGMTVPAAAKQTVISVSKKKIAVNVGFYTSGSPGGALSTAQIRKILKETKKFADTVRFYGSAGALEPAYKIAHDMKLKVVGTAWLSSNTKDNKKEMDALIRHCKKGYVSVACVGSETLLRGDLSAKKLIADIQYVRKRVKKTIPVTTADDSGRLMANKKVGAACDVLMVNIYPYWAGVEAKKGKAAFAATVKKVKGAYPGKKLIISETGWPTAGGAVNKAKANASSAARYFTDIRKWSLSTGIPVLWFDAADEPWKTSAEGKAGAHWGIMTKDCKVKSCYKKLAVFPK